MAVLNTTSPVDVPAEPMETPRNTVPSSRAKTAGVVTGYLRHSDQLLARATTAGVELALTPVKICLTG